MTTPVDVAVAERDDEDRADADALRAGVVERPAQRAGRRERLDLGHGGHTADRSGADGAPQTAFRSVSRLTRLVRIATLLT